MTATKAPTKIEWAHYTVNFWWGCTKVSPACFYCYAEAMARIFAKGKATWGPNGARWIRLEKATDELVAIQKRVMKTGERVRVFINSMSDTFEDRPDLEYARSILLKAVAMLHGVDVLLLTKRPENICRMVPQQWLSNWPAHVWVGTTIENRYSADLRISALLRVPARVRFLSMEPLLEHVDLDFGAPKWRSFESYHAYIHWVIVGGESGPGARPMNPDWARSIRDQCKAAGVPFFFKQWGEWLGGLQDGAEQDGYPPRIFNASDAPIRVGKKAAGRLLDGAEHNEFPEVRS
jgi:protein gp37